MPGENYECIIVSTYCTFHFMERLQRAAAILKLICFRKQHNARSVRVDNVAQRFQNIGRGAAGTPNTILLKLQLNLEPRLTMTVGGFCVTRLI